MGRARGPVGHTCPEINAVINAVNSALSRCRQEDHEGAADDLADVEATMEIIRDANNQLRDWGSEQEDLAIEREQEIAALERRVAELEDEVKSLGAELDGVTP